MDASPFIHRSPNRLKIAPGRSARGSPSGKSHTARTSCSNWLVEHATSVSWNELCGRGASSFTSSVPSRSRNISTARMPSSEKSCAIAARDLFRLVQRRWRQRRGEHRPGENLMLVKVERRRKHARLAVRPPRDHHRQLRLEIERLFGDARASAERLPRRTGLVRARDACLAASVVAAVARLHEQRTELAPPTSASSSALSTTLIRADRNPCCGKPALLPRAVLNDAEDRRVRSNRRVALRRRERVHPDLLDLERHHVACAREIGRRVGVVELRRDHAVGHGARRTVAVGIEHVHMIAERARRHRGHAPELAAAENADGRAGNESTSFSPS